MSKTRCLYCESVISISISIIIIMLCVKFFLSSACMIVLLASMCSVPSDY